MFAWARRVFATWTGLCEYLVFISLAVAGVANASWLWILIGAMVLLLLGWSHYRELFARAGELDARWRELAGLAHRQGKITLAFQLYTMARSLAVVLAAKLGFDCLFMTGAFLFGRAIAWLWGVDSGTIHL